MNLSAREEQSMKPEPTLELVEWRDHWHTSTRLDKDDLESNFLDANLCTVVGWITHEDDRQLQIVSSIIVWTQGRRQYEYTQVIYKVDIVRRVRLQEQA